MYWLPQLIRSDLEEKFKDMKNLSQFWSFVQDTLGDYMFQNEIVINENNEVDADFLKTFNETILSAPSKGRLIMGSMRF